MSEKESQMIPETGRRMRLAHAYIPGSISKIAIHRQKP